MAPRKNVSRKTAATKPAAKKTATKAAVKKTAPVDANKAVVENAISRVVDQLGLDNQKARYKAQRAIAYQAFLEALEAGEFADLVERAIENAGDLPTGWTVGGNAAAAAKPAPVEEEPEDEEIIEDEAETDEVPESEDEDEEEGQTELDLEEEDEVEEAPEPAKPAAKKPARRRRVARK